jgi:hypothetical protein
MKTWQTFHLADFSFGRARLASLLCRYRLDQEMFFYKKKLRTPGYCKTTTPLALQSSAAELVLPERFSLAQPGSPAARHCLPDNLVRSGNAWLPGGVAQRAGQPGCRAVLGCRAAGLHRTKYNTVDLVKI